MSQLKQSIDINASIDVIDRCITDQTLMHRWLNPLLYCEPIGAWSTEIGSRSRFVIQIPLFKPTLHNVVIERSPGLVVWEFQGFFHGHDRWECQPRAQGTHLLNHFEFEIPNPVVRWGFNTFAFALTQKDMQAQLHRLKRLAEVIEAQERIDN
ncbi:polyketide cyclase [Chroogloeocystis siderophila 5.2 s.c.1]|uniref:Polyketide cyclase n=1 Tax=Chroogloeocystis siderophila 5.2 s.c.1 TaxID=247279 RepID=A0A1U7I0A0_9CHRO|nr:polyketide cyclase [Chroogloeocystis siderophila 5.2 s.c.1]